MNDRVEHLKLIQAVIARLAGHSFLLKGWAVTVVAALLALTEGRSGELSIPLVGLVPVLGFWVLDTYYLTHERRFRDLYDQVRGETGPTDFRLSPNGKWHQFPSAAIRLTVIGLYGLLAIVLLIDWLRLRDSALPIPLVS